MKLSIAETNYLAFLFTRKGAGWRSSEYYKRLYNFISIIPHISNSFVQRIYFSFMSPEFSVAVRLLQYFGVYPIGIVFCFNKSNKFSCFRIVLQVNNRNTLQVHKEGVNCQEKAYKVPVPYHPFFCFDTSLKTPMLFVFWLLNLRIH